ncbi:MAG: 50S ribosomal protein L23 [Sediminispirochaetaceae bacterium]
MRTDQVIIEPVLTEKSNGMRDAEQKKYTFKVDPRANKTEIKYAVEQLFNVTPVSCNLSWVKSKPKSTRSRSGSRQGKTTAWKKAIVTLRTGEKIDAIDGV